MRIDYALGFNWGNHVKHIFPIAETITLFVGETGSGKSTLLDLMQVVMTADLNNVTNYNAGQTEDTTKKRDKEQRSFASYLLGGDRSRFTRRSCVGGAGLVFKDVNGVPATAYIFGRASLTGTASSPVASGGSELFILCRGVALSPEDFFKLDIQGNKELFDKDELRRTLKEKYGKSIVEFYDFKKDYMMALYGCFSYGIMSKKNVRFDEAEKMARALVRYIHPTQADNVHRFVRDELLEPKPLDKEMENLKAILQSYNRIKLEAETLKKSSDTLSDVVTKGTSALSRWIAFYRSRFVVPSRQMHRLISSINDNDKKIRNYRKNQEQAERDFQLADESLKTLFDELIQLEKQAAGSSVIAQKNSLEKDIAQLQGEASGKEIELAKSLSGFHDSLNILALCSDVLGQTIAPEISTTLSLLLDADSLKKPESAVSLNVVRIDLLDLFKNDSKLRIELENKEDDARNTSAALDRECQQLQMELKALKIGLRPSYKNEDDIKLINNVYPEANARPLCEFIEFTDDSWQQAVEGFMGDTRFSLVVHPDYEARAADLLLERKGRSRVIQGRLVLKDFKTEGNTVMANSIVNLMSFNNDVAEAFIYLNYGRVQQVESTEKLRFVRRGLTKAGVGASGYAMFPCLAEPRNCYIGEKMKARRKADVESALENTSSRYLVSMGTVSKFTSIRQQLDRLVLHDPAKLSLQIDVFREQINGILKQLQSLDLSDYEKIASRLDEVRKKTKQTELLRDSALSAKTSAQDNVNTHEKEKASKIEKLNKQTSIVTAARESYESSLTAMSRPTINEIDLAEAEAKESCDSNDAPMDFDSVSNTLLILNTAIGIHNTTASKITIIDPLPIDLQESIEGFSRFSALLERHKIVQKELDENLLRQKYEKLQEQYESFENTFKKEFCFRVYANIEGGRRHIETLKSMLRRHRFGDENFTISYRITQEFQPYYNYFKFLSSSLHLEGDTAEEHNQARENLMLLLLGDDEGKNVRELRRIADYRNYYEYDILLTLGGDEANPISLSKLGTDSGGQAQTSYYVIRSVAAFSSFGKKAENPKGKGVGFLLIDEGFNRIDDLRPEPILNFLIKDLGFQLIAAVPPQNEASFTKMEEMRYQMISQTHDDRPDHFRKSIWANSSKHDRGAVSDLIERDKKLILEAMEQGEFNFE
jgi:energy-coupling factor transporter ATP-binding protein EcfA2